MKISYVITPYNRTVQTFYTLRRLQHLTLPDEVIVIDDGTVDSLKDFIDMIPYPIRYIKRDKRGYDSCAIPRNIGLKMATGDYVLFADPECLFVTDVVAQMRDQAEKHPEKVIIAGSCYFTSPDTEIDPELITTDPRRLMERWNMLQFPFHAEDLLDKDGKKIVFNDRMVFFDHKVQATFASLFKKEWLMDIRGWDEDMSITRGGGGWGFDDVDVLARLAKKHIFQEGFSDIEIIHQYHTRAPQNILDGWIVNEKIMKTKSDQIVRNQDREWGVL